MITAGFRSPPGCRVLEFWQLGYSFIVPPYFALTVLLFRSSNYLQSLPYDKGHDRGQDRTAQDRTEDRTAPKYTIGTVCEFPV